MANRERLFGPPRVTPEELDALRYAQFGTSAGFTPKTLTRVQQPGKPDDVTPGELDARRYDQFVAPREPKKA